MKAIYTMAIRTISGKIGGYVHLKWKEGNRAVIRRYVRPELKQNHHNFGSSLKNLVNTWKLCSTGFKNDLKSYAGQRKKFYSGREIPASTNFAHFIRFIYRFRKDNPEIELSLTTKEELEAAGIPTNVASIIEQGFLPPAEDTSNLTHNW